MKPKIPLPHPVLSFAVAFGCNDSGVSSGAEMPLTAIGFERPDLNLSSNAVDTVIKGSCSNRGIVCFDIPHLPFVTHPYDAAVKENAVPGEKHETNIREEIFFSRETVLVSREKILSSREDFFSEGEKFFFSRETVSSSREKIFFFSADKIFSCEEFLSSRETVFISREKKISSRMFFSCFSPGTAFSFTAASYGCVTKGRYGISKQTMPQIAAKRYFSFFSEGDSFF
jgi:hypothetical protein